MIQRSPDAKQVGSAYLVGERRGSYREAIIFRTYIPKPPLTDFVERFWYFDSTVPAGTREHVVPNGAMDLIFSLGDPGLRAYDHQAGRFISLGGAALCGARSTFTVLDSSSLTPSIGIHFKPGGAFPFLGCPTDELRDTFISLDLAWGLAAGDLRDRLLEAPSSAHCFRLLQQSLLAQATRPLERHPAVALALVELRRVPPTRSIAAIRQRTGLSHRWFVRRFREEVGLTPKLFGRIRRLQRLLHLVKRGQQRDWAELALQGGYFDQAHLINEFRALTGVSPEHYAPGSGARTNHVLPGG